MVSSGACTGASLAAGRASKNACARCECHARHRPPAPGGVFALPQEQERPRLHGCRQVKLQRYSIRRIRLEKMENAFSQRG